MNEKTTGKREESINIGKGTLAIILVNIALFVALKMVPGFRENLLLNHEISMVLKKPWTLISVFLSHEVLIHLAFNMGVFLLFGSRLVWFKTRKDSKCKNSSSSLLDSRADG